MPLTKGRGHARPNDTTKLFKNSLRAKRLCAIKCDLKAPRTHVTTCSQGPDELPSPNPRNDNNYSEIGVRTHVVGYLRWMEWNARCLRVRLITINLANYCLALFWPFGGCKLQVYHSSWGHGRSFAAIDTVFWSGSSYRRSTHCGLIVFEIMIRRNFRSAATRTWKWKSLKRVSRVSSLAYDDDIRATIGMGK